MRRCSKCQVYKGLTEFSKSGRRGLQHYCRPCANELARQNYLENSERYKANARKRDAEIDLLIVREKAKPCHDCGAIHPPYVMQFDHIGTDKVLEISKMRRRHFAIEKIVAEMRKCEVVCANCHAERSHVRQPSPRLAAAVAKLQAEMTTTTGATQ